MTGDGVARTYRQPGPLSREEAEAALAAGTAEAVCPTLVSLAFYDPEWAWVQGQLLRFVDHADDSVRGAAAICFGHLARIRGQLDWREVVPVLKRIAREDPDAAVRGMAGDALSDIHWSMPAARRLIGKRD